MKDLQTRHLPKEGRMSLFANPLWFVFHALHEIEKSNSHKKKVVLDALLKQKVLMTEK